MLLLVAGGIVLLSIFASKISERLGIPALLLFLGLGMLAGSDGLGGIHFDNAEVARFVGIVSLVLILYAGGLDTIWGDIRPILTRGVALSTLGVIVTAVALGLFATLILGFSLQEGLLLGAIAASTDAAAVFAILRARGTHLKGKIRSLLEYESGSNDPTAVLLTISLLELVTGTSDSVAGLIVSYFLQMSLGAIVGVVMSSLAVIIINRIQLDHDGLYPVLSLALVALTYGAADLANGSGFLAVYVAGLIMGNRIFIHKRSLIRFHDGLAWLAQISMFVSLGLLVFPSELPSVIGPGLLIAAFLILVARPLSVFVCLAFSGFGLREQLFISWVGLRGAAPIILATFPLVAGIANADLIFNVVFFVVIVSVALQGTTVPFAARWLGVGGPGFTPGPLDTGVMPQSRMVEYRVPPESRLVGRQVARAGLPDTARLLLVHRYDSLLTATGGMRLRRDDVLTIVADEAAIGELDRMSGVERVPGIPLVCQGPGEYGVGTNGSESGA